LQRSKVLDTLVERLAEEVELFVELCEVIGLPRDIFLDQTTDPFCDGDFLHPIWTVDDRCAFS
jgi:hypothetical protein